MDSLEAVVLKTFLVEHYQEFKDHCDNSYVLPDAIIDTLDILIH